MTTHTTQSIADHVRGQLVGPGQLPIAGLSSLHAAKAGDLTFISSKPFAEVWPQSRATAALLKSGLVCEPGDGRALILVKDADLAMASVLSLFASELPGPKPGIHNTAVVEPGAVIAEDVHIGAHCYIGDKARIGAGSVLYPGVFVGDRCVVGKHCIIYANAVIGADGFGFRAGDVAAGQPPIVKVPHIGHVEIGDHVEIGANTCVDRGKFDATVIGHHTKIDNLCQIAHNCQIGSCVLIAGCTGIAGSVIVKDGVQIGGGSSLCDHITIGMGASLAACSGVIHDVPDKASWGGAPAKSMKTRVREELAVRQLPDLLKQYRKVQRVADPTEARP